MKMVLGGGLAGISASYHLGHDQCRVLEKNAHLYGHIHSVQRDGFTWDEGPHVSFTKHATVKQLFAEAVEGDFDEYPVKTVNYYQGHWIDHPAQSNLYQVPEPLRSLCLDSFLQSRSRVEQPLPVNYQEWLDQAFGPVFARTFPAAYTRKYWTTDPVNLTTDWVGERVFLPKVDEVLAGAKSPLDRQTHYITHVRYPRSGGYQSFATQMAEGMRVQCGVEVESIDLVERKVITSDGRGHTYERLINTLPLPVFIERCVQSTPEMKEAAQVLSCTQLLLVNVTARHPTQIDGNWFYVYDEDKWSTRINCTEKLTPGNAPAGQTGVQVEVYFSKYREQTATDPEVAEKVVKELVEMGFVRPDLLKAGMDDVAWFTHRVPWANILFDAPRREALDVIWKGLEAYGLERETQDLDAMTDWSRNEPSTRGSLVMAGRFAQWKYFWTDDCVLRGRELAQ
jgi:protoporphyrinogen oxidase